MTSPQRLEPATIARHREILDRHTPRPEEGIGSHAAVSVAAVMSEISADLETPLWWLDRAYGCVEPYLRAVNDRGAYSPEQIRALRARYVTETLALILDFEGDLRRIAAGCGPEGQAFAERLIEAGAFPPGSPAAMCSCGRGWTDVHDALCVLHPEGVGTYVTSRGWQDGDKDTAKPENSQALGKPFKDGEQQAARAARRVDR